MVATAYLLGVSTRRVEKLAASLGVTQLSKSQVSAMAKHLDEQVVAFRDRPLDQGPYAFVWLDALTQKVREGGRIVNVHALVAVGVNADGHREILGIDVASSEDGAMVAVMKPIRSCRTETRRRGRRAVGSSITASGGVVIGSSAGRKRPRRNRVHPVTAHSPAGTKTW